MKCAVVTSCSKRGFAEYGERFIKTFRQHWPQDVDLHVVSEDDLGADVSFIPLQESQRWVTFQNAYGGDSKANGRGPHPAAPHGYKIKNDYDFRCDAVKFAKKVFAIELAAQRCEAGRLFWVDADVVTFSNVPHDLLERALPSKAALSCLDRGHYHSECGFVGYNLDHVATRAFIKSFASLYLSGDVFKLKEWHDSWVFDWLRKRLNVPTHAIPHASRRHPFINSELGRFMDHCKGPRKDGGRTPKAERLIKDGTEYWA